MGEEDKGITHYVHIIQSSADVDNDECEAIIRRTVIAFLQSEALDVSCTVSVLVTDDDGIREYNSKYRGIDKATDVLSFPMQTFLKAGWCEHEKLDFDKETGMLPLGDIVISTNSVKKQAAEYENTVEYETSYLIIHSMLHLLGYDHDNEENEKIMHKKNKELMLEMGFTTDDK